MFTGLTLKNVGLIGALKAPVPPPITYLYSNLTTLNATISVARGYTSMLVKLWGCGGGNTNQNGGRGSFVRATLAITNNGTINVFIGAAGATNGGGLARARYNAPDGGSNQDFVAGAGGGAGDGPSGATGGNGGSTTGNSGSAGAGAPGGGGSQVAGGSGGAGVVPPDNGSNGASMLGGAGGSLGVGSPGGGGGGGYFGGGGGGGDASGVGDGGGGGGGSSFVVATATLVTNAGPDTSDPSWNGLSSDPAQGAQIVIVLS